MVSINRAGRDGWSYTLSYMVDLLLYALIANAMFWALFVRNSVIRSGIAIF